MEKNRPCIFYIGASLLALSQFSLADANGTGKINKIGGIGWGENSVYFGLDPKPINKPACSDHNQYDFVIDISTDKGKAVYSMLLTARSSSAIVTIKGDGVCPSGSHAEGVGYWILQP